MESLAELLSDLAYADPSGEQPACPPPQPVEQAVKELRKQCEAGATPLPDSSQPPADAAAAAAEAHAALLESASTVPKMCAAVGVATAAIDAIDRAEGDVDTAKSGLMRWGHLRANLLQVLLHVANSEARCIRILELSNDTAAAECVAILTSAAARSDTEGVRTGANLLRNLSMPASARPRIGALPDLFPALLKQVAHPDPNVQAVVGATLRILCEGCIANATIAARAASDPAGGVEGDGFGRITRLDLSRMHPFCRVELARFISIVVVACAAAAAAAPPPSPTAPEGAQQLALSAPDALGFAAFVLGGRHAALHKEFCTALRAAKATRVRIGGAEAATAWATAVGALMVPVRGSEVPLREVLRELAAAGALTATEASVLG